ncbi:MAG: hypothetical protein B6I25_01655 [Planctomycetales bacterium 4572_13]|nr:MAG: hypothetical protein B6I25_01655 [Planctomycetales bacterium 4572_13]
MILRWTIWGLLLVQAVGFCQIQNGRFEIPDPNRATEWFTPPKYWDFENYANTLSEFTPQPAHNQTIEWTIPSPFEGEYFLLLSTEDVEGPGSDGQIKHSAAWQVLHARTGDVLVGAYFFGTCDYTPFGDIGTIVLEPNDPIDGLRPITLVDIEVSDIGNFGSTDGWQTFQHTFDSSQTGDYTIRCKVEDYTDKIYRSYLAVDNLRICSAIPAYGDLNMDCGVDLLDFSVLGSVWLADCNDISDPNAPCHLADMDKSGIVDPNDLVLMSEHWLEKFWYE